MGNGIVYDVATVENAMRCLMDMQELEETPNFGKLTYKSSSDVPNNRYNIEEYKDRIDSTFYTDMATATLIYTMDFLRNHFGEQFSWDVHTYIYEYGINDYEGVDLINNSEGEFADFNGDSSILELGITAVFKQLYAYYNEFELISGEEKEKFITNEVVYKEGRFGLYTDFGMILKKTENINGTDVNFYYVGDDTFYMSLQLGRHESNINFLNDKMPGNVLNAILDNGADDINIVTFSKDCFSDGSVNELKNANWAGLAFNVGNYGNIFIRHNYFNDSVIHEIGHLFDRVNIFDIRTLDYGWNIGVWDKLAEKYAEDIATIRKGADISCGYEASEMRAKHNEFYAEAFQLYFYSEETRAALPEKVRNRIETEIEKYAS